MWGVYARGCLWVLVVFFVVVVVVFGFFFQLKYSCNIRRPLPQQSIQKATKVKAVNTEKHTSEGQLKNENEYQEIIYSH